MARVSLTVREDEDVVKSLQRGCQEVLGKKAGISYFRSESDANHIASRLKIPTVIFGPDSANYHAADEYVEIDSMVDSTKVLAYSILDLLS